MVPDLVCPSCGRRYEAGPEEPWRCTCGSPLELDWAPDPPAAPDFDRDRGLWGFDSLLPGEGSVSLGEGWTPLVEAPEWDISVKLESLFPSGSFKDRGATTTLSRAAALGVDRVLEDSSGNAGAAIALYAARAGIPADIYVPEGVKPAKRAAIAATGAEVIEIPGSREDVSEAARAAAESGDGWYASHAWNPAFFAGTATVAHEIAAQRGFDIPDAVVAPVGHGTLFLGLYRGFSTLESAGWIDSVPRLLGVQAAGVAPIVDATGGDPGSGPNSLADGVQIAEPVREREIRTAIRETDGAAIAVGEARTREAWAALSRAGFSVEPTSALAVAGLETYRERGHLDPGADVVVPLTGSGLKSEPP